ncbi:MAG: hypothetical protein SGPRY_002730 [Prymnesium sp.]
MRDEVWDHDVEKGRAYVEKCNREWTGADVEFMLQHFDENEQDYMKVRQFNATKKTFVQHSLVLHSVKDEEEVLLVLKRRGAHDWRVL